MDRNRIEGKAKEIEGKLQQGLGKAKDRIRGLPDEGKARFEREKGKREAKRELEGK